MHAPSREYEITITERKQEGIFTLAFRFNVIPEEMVSHLLKAMGFEDKSTTHHAVYSHSINPFKLAFAKEFAAALKEGAFPKTIPYFSTYVEHHTTITADKYSIAYILPNKEDTKTRDRLLVFETTEEKRESVGWLGAWLKYGKNQDSFSVQVVPRAGRTEARLLLEEEENKVVRLPNPFGSFGRALNLDGLDISSDLHQMYQNSVDQNDNKIDSSQRESRKDDDALASSQEVPRKEELAIAKSQRAARKSEVEAASLMGGNDLDSSQSSEIKPIESSQQIARNSQVDAANSQLQTRRDKLARDSSQDQTLKKEFASENLQEKIQEEEFTEENLAEIEEAYEEAAEAENCFEKLATLLPDLQNQLARGVRNADSYTKEESRYDHLEFHSLDQRSDSIYLLQLDFINSSDVGLVSPIKVEFVVDFDHEAITIEDWRNDENHELDIEHIEKSLYQFSQILGEVLGVGHQFQLLDIELDANYSEGEGKLKSILIKRHKYDRAKSEMIEFYSWKMANEYLSRPERLARYSSKVEYQIIWTNNQMSGEFDPTAGGFQAQRYFNAIGKAAFKRLLDLKHIKEGRFQTKVPLEYEEGELVSMDFEGLIEELDFGINKEEVRKEFQPKVPLQSLQAEGSQISLYELTIKYDGPFAAANGKLKSFSKLKSPSQIATIKAEWKDGTLLDFTIPYYQLDEIDQQSWETWLKEKAGVEDARFYQAADFQPLLLEHEIEYPQPDHYFSLLSEAYWRKEDTDSPKKCHPDGHSYHIDRLASSIRNYLEKSHSVLLKYPPSHSVIEGAALSEVAFAFQKNSSDADKEKAVAQLIQKAKVGDEKAKKGLNTILLKMMKASEKLQDLVVLKNHAVDHHSTDQEEIEQIVGPSGRKGKKGRIEQNREIERLIDEKEIDSKEYSEEEIEFISQYSGYGGSKLSEVNQGLLNEYYTPDEVVKMMWILAIEFGYKAGSVLEPSCGIGNFIKYAPRNVRIEGYETNKYSAKICSLLYPYAKIHNKAFEELFFNGFTYLNGQFRTEAFDLVIGNPPYGPFQGKYSGLGEKKRTGAVNYEHYFLNRGLDVLKAGGLLVYIIPNSFLRNSNKYSKQKRQLAEKCTLEFSWRLTKDIFKHTSIETDIVVLRRRTKNQ